MRSTFTTDSSAIAAAGKGNVIHVWDIVTGQEILTLDGHKSQINFLAFSPDGSIARFMQPRRRRPPLRAGPNDPAGR